MSRRKHERKFARTLRAGRQGKPPVAYEGVALPDEPRNRHERRVRAKTARTGAVEPATPGREG
jgi:hypothetical protein